MTAQDYEVWTRPLRRHPSLTKALLCINKVLTLLVYLAYPLLLLTLLLQKDARLSCGKRRCKTARCTRS